MKFFFSAKTTLICGLLACGMLRASFWQWSRYEQKQIYIKTLEQRLEKEPIPLNSALKEVNGNFADLVHRRLFVSGTYDFEHEIVLRNRRYQEISGTFVLTPFRLEGEHNKYLLISRGFIPLSKSESKERKVFQKDPKASITVLIKEASAQRLFAPPDPETGSGLPWVDAWLRVDVEKMNKQLPYSLMPVYGELMDSQDIKGAQAKMLESKSGRDEMFMLSGNEVKVMQVANEPDLPYPVPVYDTIIPPGRHFGYIFEWAFMALATLLIGVVLQLRPPRVKGVQTA